MRKSKCQGLGELSGRGVIQNRKFIFRNVDKYLKGCRMREKLSNCTQIRDEEKKCEVAIVICDGNSI